MSPDPPACPEEPAGAPLRVLIVEDHGGTRRALAAALRASGFAVVGEFGGGAEAAAAAPRLEADVAVVDLGLRGISGVETIRRLGETSPGTAGLVYTIHEEPERIVDAIAAGAAGYLLKGTPLSEICRAVDDVARGLAPISPAVARRILDVLRARDSGPALREPGLTERESDVLRLLVRGHSYASAGASLGMHVGTVQTHVKSIYRKLGVSSKTEAAWVAMSRGPGPGTRPP